MKKYDSYKNSGIEWIGEIPSHWDAKRIKLYSPVKRGASPRPIDDPKYFDDNGEYAWVRIADVTASDRYLLNTTQRLSELGASLSVKRHEGDFFLSIAGSVGKPMITKIKCCIHDGFVYFPNLTINPEFLYYIFQTGLPYLGLGKLGTQLNLNTETVGNIFIPIPSEGEIEIITNYLDQKTTQIDNLIAKKERLIQLLEEERTAIINHAVTKGLDPTVPMKDSGIEWLGEIPAHWEVKKLKFCIQIHSGKGINNENLNPKGEYAVWGGNGIMGYTDDFSSDGNDLIIGRVGALCGNVHLVEGRKWISDNALFARTTENENFMELFLKFLDLNRLANKNAQPLITGTMVKEQYISLPKYDEQEQIATYIENQHKRIDKLLNKTQQEIELLKEYKTTLISEVVTGKVDVRNEILN